MRAPAVASSENAQRPGLPARAPGVTSRGPRENNPTMASCSQTARAIFCCILAVALAIAARAADTIPILAWHGPPANETTPERYRELAAAGFTDNFSGFPNAAAVERALEIAREAGIRLWISLPELQSDPEGTVKRFQDHPALAGYYLRDEPSAADFAGLAAWARRIQAVDRKHPCYINLFPNYANAGQLATPTYTEYVARFIAEVPVPFVSFDHYPVVGRSLRGEWYENLEIIAKAATAAKKPFWAFVLAVAHNPYPIAEIEHLRLQAFSNLAYGAQVIQHFTYWTPVSDVWNFHQAPIEKDGKRTEVYDRVKKLNAEIRGLSPVFLGARAVNVGHLGPLPQGTRTFEPAGAVKAIDADGPALVSRLENAGAHYLVVVNRALEGERRVQITFADAVEVSRVGKDRNASAVTGPTEKVTISPGDVAVYRWR